MMVLGSDGRTGVRENKNSDDDPGTRITENIRKQYYILVSTSNNLYYYQ